MISLTSTLQAAQRTDLRSPALSFVGSDLLHGVPRLSWSRWYTGAEGDHPHAACVTGDGSLIRVRNDSGTVRVQRVANPTSGSTYSSWTSLGTGAVSGTGIAIAAEVGGDRLVMVYVKTGGVRLSYRFSSDDGASWSSASDVQGANESFSITSVAVAWTGNGWRCYYDQGGTLYTRSESANTSGNWSSATSISGPAAASAVVGLAAWYFPAAAEVGLVMTFNESSPQDMVVATYNAGAGAISTNAWHEHVRGAAGGAFGPINAPTLNGHGDTALAGWNERETGDVTYSRTFLARGEPSQAGDGWYSEPQPIFSTGIANGVMLAHYPGSTSWFACTPHGVWNATGEAGEEEYGDRVIRVDLDVGLYRGRARVTLDNADGAVDSASLGLRPGGSVVLRLGYLTSAGAEYGTAHHLTVVSVREYVTRRGARRVDATAVGPWERLAETRAARAVQRPGSSGSRARFFGAAFSRAGGVRVVADGTSAPSADWTTDHAPDLTVRPGETWRAVAERLLSPEAEHVVVDGDQARVRSISASQAADEALVADGAGHRLLTYERVRQLSAYNWARVSSSSRYVDRWTDADLAGEGPRMRPTVEEDGDSNTKVTEYGDAALARARWMEETGQAVVPWHAGLELLDVVDITDARIGASGELARIIGMRGLLDTDTGAYEATLSLATR